jgi:hypothetical protein
MSGETTVTRGKTFDESTGEVVDLAKLNLTAKPSVRVNQESIGTRELIDGSVTSDKLSEGVLNQINADATLADGSVTTAKLANGAVTVAKLNQNVLDLVVQRDTAATTIGSFLRYVDTAGVTEEVTLSEILNSSAILGQHAEYNTTAGQALGTGATRIDYGTKVKDDDTNVTTGGSWVYTVPETGLYNVSCMMTVVSGSSDVKSLTVTAGSRTYKDNQSTTTQTCHVHFTTYLTAAQTVYAEGTSAGSLSLTTNASDNYITITRV